MSSKEKFAKRLKALRGKIPIKELARDTETSQTVIYKAESGEESVSWKTIEAAYGDLCGSKECYAELLMMWALTQSERPVALHRAQEAMETAIQNAANEISNESMSTVKEIEMMPLPEQRKFAMLAGLYRRSPMVRKMADVWMETEREWEKSGGV